MTTLTPFDFAGQQVRVIEIDGEPWFVASDVARILGYRMASDMTRRLDEDDKGTHSARTPSGDQQMTVITEAGLYAAILGSQIESARDFKSLCGSVIYDFKAEFRAHFEARETLYLTPQGVGLIRKRLADRKAAIVGATP